MKENNNNFNINFNDEDMTVNSLLDAISEIEYPKYLLDAVAAIQEWLHGLAVNIEAESTLDDESEDNNNKIKDLQAAEELEDKNIEEVEEAEEAEDVEEGEVEFEQGDDFIEFLKSMFDGGEVEPDDIDEGLEALFEKIDAIDDGVDVIPNTHKPAGNRDAMIINILSPESDGGLRTAIDYAAVFNRKKCKRVWILSDSFVFDEAAHFAGHISALEQQGITIRFILINPWGWIELPLSRASALRKQIVWRGGNNISQSRNSSSKNDLTGD